MGLDQTPFIKKEKELTNHPLTNREQALVLISVIVISILFFPFTLLILPLLGGGLFLTKKNEDFSYLATAISIARGFLLLVIAAYACAAVYYGYLYYTYEQSVEYYYALAYCSVIGLVTYFLLSQFIFKPLRLHQEWVEKNGIFASRSDKEKTQKTKSITITQSENLRSYSVADELLKWANLKDGGHISQEEYDEARRKLLHRAH